MFVQRVLFATSLLFCATFAGAESRPGLPEHEELSFVLRWGVVTGGRATLAIHGIETFQGKSAFSTWLHRVSVNTVLMSLRKKKRVEISLENDDHYEEEPGVPRQIPGGPDPSLMGLFDRENLKRVFRQMPDGYKRMLVLHDVLGYEHNEIATLVNCSVGNSKSQLHKARVRMRTLL